MALASVIRIRGRKSSSMVIALVTSGSLRRGPDACRWNSEPSPSSLGTFEMNRTGWIKNGLEYARNDVLF